MAGEKYRNRGKATGTFISKFETEIADGVAQKIYKLCYRGKQLKFSINIKTRGKQSPLILESLKKKL